jgi:hypothetical protein
MSIKLFKGVAACSLSLFALGCTESTTPEDVADARQEVSEQQQDVAEARHEAMKPALDADEAEDIQEEQQDVAEAKQDLAETQRDFQATQARDAFAVETQKTIEEADRQIEALEARHANEEGATADATKLQIDDLKSRRASLAEALDDLKGEDLAKWQDHKQSVQVAQNELNAKLREIR